MRPESYWFAQGRDAERAVRDGWRQVLDSQHGQAASESEAMAATLRAEALPIQEDEQRCMEALGARAAAPAAAVTFRLLEGLGWLFGAGFLLWAAYQLALHGLPLLGKFEEGRHVLAGVLAIGTAVAFEASYRQAARVFSRQTVRKVVLGISVMPVVCLLASTLSMAMLRSEYVAVQQALAVQEKPAVIIEGSAPEAAAPKVQEALDAFYRRSHLLTTLLMFLASAGLEIVAALALHEAIARLRSSTLVLAQQRRLRQLRSNAQSYARAIAQWERYPTVVREAFTRGALLESGRRVRRRALMLATCGAISLLVVLLLAIRAKAEEAVIVALDLSVSSAGNDFRDNAAGVERLIGQLRPASRFTVVSITEQSFASPLILAARLSVETGVFDERLKAGRQQLGRAWRERSKTLRDTATESDIFGALRKVAVVREEASTPKVLLILFSDMRQHGRGYRFDGHDRLDPPLLHRVERDGLIAPLPHVEVWVLGAHAVGISDTYWLTLRAFWSEYLQRAGATLKAFSAERRWSRE